jgi:hypothetical protein
LFASRFKVRRLDCSSREASFLQLDSTRLFVKLLRMFQNAFAFAWHQPADVTFVKTVVESEC